MEIPILKVSVQKDQFSIITKILPAHEYPIFLVAWGQENLEIIGKSEEVHKIDSIESEVKRMVSTHGENVLKEVFGASYIDGIEVSINRIIEKEKGVNDSKNAAKSKDGTRTETRV
tara:strand:+ start:1097 stop:1444 length:348 start_codon:yes stop_codon:yes gene_type:complete